MLCSLGLPRAKDSWALAKIGPRSFSLQLAKIVATRFAWIDAFQVRLGKLIATMIVVYRPACITKRTARSVHAQCTVPCIAHCWYHCHYEYFCSPALLRNQIKRIPQAGRPLALRHVASALCDGRLTLLFDKNSQFGRTQNHLLCPAFNVPLLGLFGTKLIATPAAGAE